nr:MAG TPA: Endonuclease/Exonuclease/phosphatase family protein [Caudoviricetes sp.]
MFGSISHKPDIYCYQETADWRYNCMDYRKQMLYKKKNI